MEGKSEFVVACMKGRGEFVPEIETSTQTQTRTQTVVPDKTQMENTQTTQMMTQTQGTEIRTTASVPPRTPSSTPPIQTSSEEKKDTKAKTSKESKKEKRKERLKPYMWEDIEAEPFFHGLLPGAEITRILKRDGDFLVVTEQIRKKQKVVVKIQMAEKVESFPVHQRSKGEYFVMKKCFTTISDLIAHYWAEQELIGDNCRLIRPVRRKFWEIGNHQVQRSSKIGSGALGEVWRGTLRQMKGAHQETVDVGIKIPKKEPFSEEVRHLIKQARHWHQFNHNHLLKVHGVTVTSRPVMLIEEMAEGGTLLDLLQKEGARTLKLKDRARYSLEAAKGMEYLEHQRYLHNALGARNCLLDANKVLKLSDYGIYYSVARKSGEVEINIRPRAKTPIRWQAPETLVTNQFTFQTDVWSYGILVWEIMTDGAMPYPDLNINQVIHRVSRGTEKMDLPVGTPDFLSATAQACWNTPEERPTFKKIRAQLEAEMKKRSMI